jgi:hypothetical protein
MSLTQSTDADESVRITARDLLVREVRDLYIAGFDHLPAGDQVESIPATVQGSAYMSGYAGVPFDLDRILAGCREERHAWTVRTASRWSAPTVVRTHNGVWATDRGGLHRAEVA